MSPIPFLAGVALLIATPSRSADDAALAAELKAKTQTLVDAIAPGKTATWQEATDPNLVFVTESNEVLTRTDLLKELTPLPKGLVGSIKVTDYRLLRHGNTAVATYIADETLDYHGQILKTKFRTTDTWYYEDRSWKMIGSMTLAVLNDPPAISLPPSMLDEYVGSYELTPDIHYTVRVDKGHLFGQREGGKEVELQAEAPNLFFVAGSPRSRKVFYRDLSGRVTGFGDRREGQDIKWKRLP